MPQATDIVIQDGAATPNNKTFSLLHPAAGDSSPAAWWLKEGAVASVFPSIELTTRKNANGDARKLVGTLKVPSSHFDAFTGRTIVGPSAVLNFTVTIPTAFPEAIKGDFAAYVKNLMADALVNACIRDAMPAT